MALPTTTKSVVLVDYPVGLPDPEKNFKTEERPLPDLKEGDVLIKVECLSVDPYMRGRMRPGVSSYVAPFRPGHPLQGGAVAKVVASRSESWKVGDSVQGMLDWSEYSVVAAASVQHLPPVPNVPLSYFLGVLGMPGMTAYLGLLEVGKPKAGETVVVSGAAGAVGYLVGQIAKILGCFVIGIAGSDEKVELIKKAGFDAGINYKTTTNMSAAIKALAPKGVDVYFDNVGGTIADAVFENLNRFARVACCGAISSYNDTTVPTGPRREFQLISKSIKQEGFIVSQWLDKWPAGIKQMAQWLQEGKIKYSETTRHGLENTPKAFVEMLTGENIGKMIVSLSS